MSSPSVRTLSGLLAGPVSALVARSKQQGRAVVGYFCHYVPPEIILATGALPFRLRAPDADDSSLGDAYMSERVCTYVRHVVSLALADELGGLDAVVCSNTCDHVRRAADLFRHKARVPYVGFVSVPRALRESLLPYYRGELDRLHRELAAHLGVPATAESLRAAIAELNEVRRRLLAMTERRRRTPARLSGADALVATIAAQTLPSELVIPWLDDLLSGWQDRPAVPGTRARVVLVGAELDEPRYVQVIENEGALVVADQLCFGTRSVLAPLDEAAADPLDAIARSYFFQPSCARMIGAFPDRWDALRSMLRVARADGVVFERLVFCDPWGAEQHNLTRRCTEHGIPLLALTREYGIVPTGQLRTRVQAFVERIEIARHKERAS